MIPTHEIINTWEPCKRVSPYEQIIVWSDTHVLREDQKEAEDFLQAFTHARYPMVFIGGVVSLPEKGSGDPEGRPDSLFLVHWHDVLVVDSTKREAMAKGGREFGKLFWWEEVFREGKQHTIYVHFLLFRRGIKYGCAR